MTFDDFLKKHYMIKGYNQSEFARILDVDFETFSKWNRGITFPRKSEWDSLLEKLPLTVDTIWEMYELHKEKLELRRSNLALKRGAPVYYAKSFRDLILDKEWTLGRISDEMDIIADNFPLPENPGNEMGSKTKWVEVMELTSDTGYAIFCNKDMVGYWYFIPVTSAIYEKIINGENVNETLRATDIRAFNESGDYDIYFVDLFVLPTHLVTTVRINIFNGLKNIFIFLARKKLFVRRIAANITQIQAQNLCVHRGFKPVIDHQCHTIFKKDLSGNINYNETMPSKIWEVRLSDNPEGDFFGNNEQLKKIYKSHFQKTVK